MIDLEQFEGHTPGPWGVTGRNGYLNQVGIGPSIGCAYGAGDEVRANARLIAAAPDLLAEVKRLREVNAELVAVLHVVEPRVMGMSEIITIGNSHGTLYGHCLDVLEKVRE